MDIEVIKIEDKKQLEELFTDCWQIVEENLEVNGGTLKQSNLIERDYKWSHLVLLKRQNKCLGFALMRFSEYDQHNTSFDNYYYLSQIVISKNFQHEGLGTYLLNYILENVNDIPLIASVHKNNTASLRLFGKNMVPYSQNNNYVRFMDKNFYKTISDDSQDKQIK